MTRTHLPKSLTAAAAAIALVIAIGLTTAFASDDSTVALTVDGTTNQVPLDGATVADVLDDLGLEVSEHDLLSPAASTELSDGDHIALRRATELKLVVDGKPKTVWVVADNVGQALAQAGFGPRAQVSASRSRALSDDLSLRVSTPKKVRVVGDGKVIAKTVTAGTVGEAVKAVGIALRVGDHVVPDVGTPLRSGTTITVARRTTEVETVPAGTDRRPDSSMTEGQTRTLKAGEEGRAVRTYLVKTVGSGDVERVRIASRLLEAPVDAVVAYGTQPAPEVEYNVSTGGLNFAALAECESGGNPSINTGNGYYGLYQFSLPTWRSVGGSGLPSEASAAEQTMRAKILYDRSGPGQWPTCGVLL